MLKPPKAKFQYLKEESFLTFVKNSVGSKAYQSFYVKKGSGKLDVLRKGDVSCAFFVSGALYLFGAIKKPHFTVSSTAADMLSFGARKVSPSQLRPGDVLIWVPKKAHDGLHNHIGFYIGSGKAISNSDKARAIVRHDHLFNGKRKIELALRPNFKDAHAKN